MKLLKDTIWNSSSPRPKGNFLRPLVVALVMLLFSSLILVMGIMDMGRLDKTLVGFMENRGLDIITAVENVAQENLAYLYQTLKDDKDERENAFVPIDDEEESAPQKALTKGLVALAREIDIRWKAEHLNEEDLRKIARDAGVPIATIQAARTMHAFLPHNELVEMGFKGIFHVQPMFMAAAHAMRETARSFKADIEKGTDKPAVLPGPSPMEIEATIGLAEDDAINDRYTTVPTP